MRLKQKAVQMKELAQVRGLQRLRSEAEAARAAAALATRNEALAQAEHERDAGAQAWLEAVSANAVSPEIAGLWSQVLRRREAAVGSAERNADQARRERDRCSEEFCAATMRCEVADDLAREAQGEYARQHEERVLQDALDAHAMRGRRER